MFKMNLILIFSLFLMGGNSALAFGKKGGGFAEKFKSLNLSEDQLEKLKQNRQVQKEKMQANRTEVKALKEQIQEGFKSNLSDQELEKLHSRLKEKKAEMEDLRFAKMLYLKNILNEEQRKKFSEFKDEHKGKWKNKKRNKELEE